MHRPTLPALLAALLLGACQALPADSAPAPAFERMPVVADLAVAHAPYDSVEVDWKQRIDQPYVYIEEHGSYTSIGRVLQRVFEAAQAQGLRASGPPFALYYDDPGQVPVEQLRMRACLPVAQAESPRAPLGFEVLDSTTVVYAFVAGPYPDVPRAYAPMFSFLKRLNWVVRGPIREIYMVSPGDVRDWSELVTEVQIPATSAR